MEWYIIVIIAVAVIVFLLCLGVLISLMDKINNG